jgi:WD40 repeat protein
MGTHRGVLTSMADAVDAEAHNLMRWPAILRQQLGNRLQFDEDVADALSIKDLFESARTGTPRAFRLSAPPRGYLDRGSASVLDAIGGPPTVYCCSLSAERLLLGGSDGSVRIVGTRDMQETTRVAAHEGFVFDVEWHPDGNRFVSCGRDGRVVMWSSSGPTPLWERNAGHGFTRACTIGPTGAWIATVGQDGTMRLWSTSSGDALGAVQCDRGDLSAVAASPAGDLLACGGDDAVVRIVSVRDSTIVVELSGHRARIAACAFTPDGRTLLSTGYDGSVLGWDLAAGANAPRTVARTTDPIACLAVEGSGESVVFGGEGLALLEAPVDGDGRSRRRALHGDEVMCCAVAPDGSAFSSGRAGVLHRSPPRRDDAEHLRSETGHDTEVTCCTISADGRQIASGEGQLTTGGLGGLEAYRVDASPEVRLWRRDGVLIHTLQGLQGRVTACRYDPTGRSLVTTDVHGHLSVWSTDPPNRVIDGEAWYGSIDDIEFSGDGRWLALTVGLAQGAWIRIHDLAVPQLDLSETGAVVRLSERLRLRGTARTSGEYTVCAFSLTDLVAGTTDGSVLLWRPPWSQPVIERAHPGRGKVTSIAVTTDGSSVVAGFEDGTVVGLSPDPLMTVADLRLHEGPVASCRFTEGGETLMTAGADATVRLWDWPSGLEVGLLPLNGRASSVDVTASEPRGCAGTTSGALYVFHVLERADGPASAPRRDRQ